MLADASVAQVKVVAGCSIGCGFDSTMSRYFWCFILWRPIFSQLILLRVRVRAMVRFYSPCDLFRTILNRISSGAAPSRGEKREVDIPRPRDIWGSPPSDYCAAHCPCVVQ